MKKAPSALIGNSVGKGGRNNSNDIRAVQALLNLPSNMTLSGLKKPLEIDGELGKATQDAIDLYQRNVMKAKIVDGRVDRSGGMIHRLEQGLPPMPSFSFSQPRWLEIACAEEGNREDPGRDKNNQRILTYLSSVGYLSGIDDMISTGVKDAAGNDIKKKTGYKLNQVDETAWCACFVNWCLAEAGEDVRAMKGKAAGAEHWRYYGKGGDLLIGNICIIRREKFGDSSSGWHVGFYIGGDPKAGYAALLGGNQGNRVCRRWYAGFIETFQRWPG